MNYLILWFSIILFLIIIALIIAFVTIGFKTVSQGKHLIDKLSSTIISVTGSVDSLIQLKEYEKFHGEKPKTVEKTKVQKKEKPSAKNGFNLKSDKVIM